MSSQMPTAVDLLQIAEEGISTGFVDQHMLAKALVYGPLFQNFEQPLQIDPVGAMPANTLQRPAAR